MVILTKGIYILKKYFPHWVEKTNMARERNKDERKIKEKRKENMVKGRKWDE